ncbi:MAG TPA: glycosyltransferase family 4 protein [Planctomicrobium sp.]|nr:glycosyltransferase family 4 protein [Planctomicrobium sp.]
MTSAYRPDEITVVIQDLHHRITGVSATVQNVHQVQKKRYPIVMVSHRHDVAERTSLWKALKICRTPTASGRPRIWHSRRNYEMMWGLIFKHLFRCPLKLVFTAAAKRKASPFPRFLVSKMNAVIATSPDAARFQKRVDAVVPHGVDCQRLAPPESKRQCMEEFGHPDTVGVGIFGRVRPEKGTDLFVRAMIEVLPKFPQCKAFIIGRTTTQFSAFEADLREQISQAGLTDRFVWMGEVPYGEVPRVFQAMSLVVAPARYEGFGVVPLEAMSTGSPVVATRTGEYAEMITNGKNGWLVSIDDLPALTDGITDCLSDSDRLAAMGKFGRQFVLDRFSVEREADAIGQVYEKVWGTTTSSKALSRAA